MYFGPGSEPQNPRSYPTKVDLAMEVVSEGSDARRRDQEAGRFRCRAIDLRSGFVVRYSPCELRPTERNECFPK
jgi:hypothetical protein